MKKEKLLKKISLFALTAICIFSIIACNSNGMSKSGYDDIILENDSVCIKTYLDENFNKQFYLKKDTFLEFDKVFYKGKKHFGEEKYSDITQDGKILWKQKQDIIYNKNFINKNIFDFIRINGKNKKIPINFSELSSEFSNFDSIDWKKVKIKYDKIDKNNKISLKVIDKKYKNQILFEFIKSDKEDLIFGELFDKDNIYICDFFIKNNEIIRLENKDFLGKMDIKINVIGIGSTLNEMYNYLGMPNSVKSDAEGLKIQYKLYNSNEVFIITFYAYTNNLSDFLNKRNKNVLKTYPNIIDGISIMNLKK
jgi:lipoprotein